MADEAGESSTLLQQTKSTPTTLRYSTKISIQEAAYNGNIEAVNVNTNDDILGRKILHIAAVKGHKEIAASLRKHGGKTAKELGVNYLTTDSILRKHGAKTAEELKAAGN